MNILELDQFDLKDAVRFHQRLNPKLWGPDERLLPEVRQALLDIAADFQEFLGVDGFELKDITISGSNAAYAYTPYSDIDLHLVVDIPERNDEVYNELFSAKKYQYNNQNQIQVRGADVELYVQDANEPHISQGVFSVRDNTWRSVPRRRRAAIDDSEVKHKYQDLQERIKQAIASGNALTIAEVIAKVKQVRQAGLDKAGEFSTENIAFKMLRNQGLIEKLFKARDAAKSRELSLKERERQQQRQTTRYGFVTPVVQAGNEQVAEEPKPEPPSVVQQVQEFYRDTVKRLGIKNPPRMRIHRDPAWSERNHSFGRYDPDTHELHIAVNGRHILDVFRTLAHELTHSRQHEVAPLPDNAGATGSAWENEANALAGEIMRDYAEANPDEFASDQVREVANKQPPPDLNAIARQAAQEFGVPWDVVQYVMYTETGWMNNPEKQITARSPAGAQGVMQLMPVTARSLGVKNVFDPVQNIRGGVQFLAQLMKRYNNNIPLTLMAYNWGPTNVTRWQQTGSAWELVPAETQKYVAGYGGKVPTGGVMAMPKGKPRTVPQTPDTDGKGYWEKKFQGWGQNLRQKLGLEEGASGYIPSEKEKNDPRFKTALTVDIKPDTLQKNAAKLGSRIARDGRPPLLRESETIMEVAMTPKALASWATTPEAQGIVSGFEAELCFQDMSGERDSDDYELDWDADERARSIDDIIDFFRYDDHGFGLSPDAAKRLRIDLIEEYQEWLDGQISEDDLLDAFTEFMNDRVWPQRRREYIEDVLQDQHPDSWQDIIDASDDKDDPNHKLFLAAEKEAREIWQEDIATAYERRDSDYDEFYEEWRDDFMDNNDEAKWLRGHYPYMSDISNHFNLDWPYYIESSMQGGYRNPDELRTSLADAVNASVRMSQGYHNVERRPGLWVIETDSSIKPDDFADSGYEIISPPQPLQKTLADLQTVLDWARSQDGYTNTSTGLHMNISIPYRGADVDYVKLLLFMGDDFVLKEFERQAIHYCRSSLAKLREQAAYNNPSKMADAFKLMRSNLMELAGRTIYRHSGEKYQSAHVHKDTNIVGRKTIEKPLYIEFRGPGGNYLDKGDKFVVTTMLRLARAMQIAGDPSAERKEYAKKLYKFLAPAGGDDTMSLFSKYSSGEITAEELKKQWASDVIGKTPDHEVAKPVEIFNTKTGEVLTRQVMPDSEIRAWIENNVDRADWMDIDYRYVSDASVPLAARRKGLAARIKGTDPTLRPGLITYTAHIKIGNYPSILNHPFVSPDLGNDFAKGTAAARRSLLKAGYSEEQLIDFRIQKITSEDGPTLLPSGASSRDQEFTGVWEIVSRNTDEVVSIMSGLGNSVADAEAHAANWARDTGFDDPIYVRPVMRARDDLPRNQGEVTAGGEQSSDANYEIIDFETMQPVFRFIANTDTEAYRKFRDWLSAGDRFVGQYTWRRIHPQFTVDYTISGNDSVRTNRLTIAAPNADAAMAMIRDHLEQSGYTVDRIEAEPAGQQLSPPPETIDISMPGSARGTESLPPGNTRWLILDPNDREVYSFVHRSNQGEANLYAANWLRREGLLGSGEFMVVPAR